MASSGPQGLARRVDDDLWLLDTRHQGVPGVVASYLIEGTRGLALVDVGPASTAATVMAGIREAGYEPQDVTALILTHIHLDHAGATGTLLGWMPRAHVYVHPLGAAHLAEPSKLLASAARIYGDQMERLWGRMLPVAAERIKTLANGERVTAGDRTLEALHTPGHAVHHIAFHDASRRAIFPGDVAGVRIAGAAYVRPPTPPPDLSLEDWKRSVARLRTLAPSWLYLPHFGKTDASDWHWERLLERLDEWGAFVLRRLRKGEPTDEIAAALARQEDPQIERAGDPADASTMLRTQYEHATNYQMTVAGYERYYRKVRPDLLAS